MLVQGLQGAGDNPTHESLIASLSKIHDFNPGISDRGLFWVARIDPDDVSVNPGNGRAVMDVRYQVPGIGCQRIRTRVLIR